jgi:hypothetical protein
VNLSRAVGLAGLLVAGCASQPAIVETSVKVEPPTCMELRAAWRAALNDGFASTRRGLTDSKHDYYETYYYTSLRMGNSSLCAIMSSNFTNTNQLYCEWHTSKGYDLEYDDGYKIILNQLRSCIKEGYGKLGKGPGTIQVIGRTGIVTFSVDEYLDGFSLIDEKLNNIERDYTTLSIEVKQKP